VSIDQFQLLHQDFVQRLIGGMMFLLGLG